MDVWTFCTASFVVVLDNVLNVGSGLFLLLMFTLGGGESPTLCGGSLFNIFVSVVIIVAWRIFSLTVDGIVFCRAFRRWPAAMSILSASQMVGTVQWAG